MYIHQLAPTGNGKWEIRPFISMISLTVSEGEVFFG